MADPARAGLRGEMVEALVAGLPRMNGYLHLHVLVDLDRSFTPEQLLAAARETVARLPVLDCRYEASWWRDRWVPCTEDLATAVHHETGCADVEEATRSWVRTAIDFETVRPFRVALFEHGAGSRLVITLHHMVTDGGGTMATANVLAAALMGTDTCAPVSRDRRLSQLLADLRLGDLPTLLVELLREGIQPLSVLRVRSRDRGFPASGDADDAPRWRTLALDDDASGRFLGRCREATATINDGLVAAAARISMARSDSGPACAGYTIDLRRFLRGRRLTPTNLHGVSLVVVPRDALADPHGALRTVSDAIGEQKRKLPGLSYALLPALSISWLPHGLLRFFGSRILRGILGYLDRGLAVTNIGALDDYLAPFGDHAMAASMLGPFIQTIETPVVIATGFRGNLTLHVCGCGNIAAAGMEALRDEIRGELIADHHARPEGATP